MLLVRAAIYTLFVLLTQSPGGHTRSTAIIIILDSEHFSNNSNSSGLSARPCMDHSCIYYSFDQAFSNITSNVLINITASVSLSSIIPLVGIANITIRGHQNPTVNCNNYGGLSFVSCYNLTIEGITWKGCGRGVISNNNSSHPVIQLHNSTNVRLTNCTFQYSMGQAVVLAGVSGDVNINHCNFSSNRHYKSNGMAVHYSDLFNDKTPLYLTITGCTFCYNEGAKSVVYFGHTTKVHEHLCLQNSTFYQNKGVSIYLSNKTLHVNGNIEFHNNVADSGGGILISDYSNVVFYKSSKVNFVNNTADRFGGAIFITNHSSVLFAESPTNQQYAKTLHENQKYELIVTFDNNRANRFGGAIYVNNSNLVFGKNVMVKFNENKAVHYEGGAICTDANSVVLFEENCNVTFHNNKAAWNAGAVIIYASSLTFKGNSAVIFNNNTADVGGAVYIVSSNVTVEGNTAVMFANNKAQKYCGAIVMTNSTATFERNSTVDFYFNHGASNGGAACIDFANVTFGGNSRVTFYDNKAYQGGAIFIRNSSVTFKDNSTTSFYTNEADFGGALYICLSTNATFIGNSVVTFYDNVAKYLCGALFISDSTSTFEENTTIKFNHNHAKNSGGALCTGNCNTIFAGNSVVMFNDNKATQFGGAMCILSISIVRLKVSVTLPFYDSEVTGTAYYGNSSMIFSGNSNITLNNNTANRGGAIFTWNVSAFMFQGNSRTIFYNNTCNPNGLGGALHVDNSSVTFDENAIVKFNNNRADNAGGLLIVNGSVALFSGDSTIIFHDNEADIGGALHVYNSSVTFDENTIVKFNNNRADNAGGLLIVNGSIALFAGDSTVIFHDNEAFIGGAVFMIFSTALFGGHSSVILSDNTGSSFGHTSGAMCLENSIVIFDDNSTVTFNNNKGNACGGALFATESNTTIKGKANIKFIGNEAITSGGALCIDNNTNITFTENSTTILENNQGLFGGGAITSLEAVMTFEGNSVVILKANEANIGGALLCGFYSDVKFKENSMVIFDHNEALIGGALCFSNYTNATLEGNSTVIFINNRADYSLGGAMYILYYSSFTIQENSNVIFNDNIAQKCGAMCVYNSTVTFKGHSIVEFNHNQASIDGGAVCISNSSVTFGEESRVTFINNGAIHGYGGAMYIDQYSTLPFKGTSAEILISQGNGVDATHIYHHSNVTFKENSNVTFSLNKAYNGGAIYSYDKAHVMFQGNSTTTFKDNIAIQGGGVLYSYAYCGVSFKENSVVTFSHNKALQGGVIYSQLNSYIKFEGSSTVKFIANAAVEYGGAINLFTNTFIMFTNNVRVMFNSNGAKNGGAIYSDNTFITVMKNTNFKNSGTAFTSLSNITFAENSSVTFTNNTALQDGGSIYLSDHSTLVLIHNSKVVFSHNTARDYGGAIYAQSEHSLLIFNTSDIHFIDNRAGTRNESLYINVLKSYNINNTKGIDEKSFPVATSPSKLVLYSPARCINGTDTECSTYFINNIMLGKEITLNGCVLDYYNQPAETAQFLVTGMDQGFKISSANYISISCNHTTQGITVIGDLHKNNSYNYSMNISLYVIRFSESKVISVNLKIQFSQCHPGFLYFKESQSCECYNNSEIISCSGSSSTIKRGYWFGSVTGKSTVTTCPTSYCNFTCCEITNGIYHLSPIRTNQCRSHRSGVACGNCEKGYTLSFDSAQCIGITKCSIGQMILVTTLTLLYWISIIIAFFTMMYFKVPIGSLYAIVYYYSMLDILLSQDYFILSGLYNVVSITSSLAKLTPQFLGQFCLVRNMSGIDQQFIHYVHPTAISMFLILISMMARRSHRISSFISRGIINFICFILLLSYTSVATTSLLLMRSLTFMDVDKVYTYLSPDIEYFHGRHLAYVLVAVLFTIVIVIGLPLLLLLEPFLNSKINFIKIKPLLDQFQGCYKDRYRSFAAYYMICRIVIILLVIVRIFDEFTTQYLLLITCAFIELIHLIIQPYVKTIHNIFDGVILQLIVIIPTLPIIEFVDNYNRNLIAIITYILIILPIISFITIKLLLHKSEIKYAVKHWLQTCSRKIEYTAISTGDVELTSNETETTTEDDVRGNTTTVPTM